MFSGDTACPYQIRSTQDPAKQRKRFPDAIGIGIAKSGTGSMAFLDCHSKIRFRALEPGVFPLKRFDGGAANIYTDHWPFTYGTLEGEIKGDIGGYLIPEVADDEFLIEKTPTYSEQYKGQGSTDVT